MDNVTVDSLRTMQEEDETLKKFWQLAAETKQGQGKVQFVVKEGLLYQELRLDGNETNHCRLIVPQELRRRIIEKAHDSLLSRHQSNKKTVDRVISKFHWPGVCEQVKRYCKLCGRCQESMLNDPMMSDEFESETFQSAEDTSKRSESTLTQPEEADGSRDDEAAAMLCIFIDEKEKKSEADISPDSAMLSLNNVKQKESFTMVRAITIQKNLLPPSTLLLVDFLAHV